ncbi:hypothetical protein Tco_0625273 [Tanacetum coccineum]|uniref:Uncharacterized protein n=1 Tax=Tanacetum coccineum TaxID=301880 RepID=A0ABQ4WGC2_9ASTR
MSAKAKEHKLKDIVIVRNFSEDRIVQKKPEENVQKGCTGDLLDRTLSVSRTVAAVCRLAGRGLRVAVYRSLKIRAIAVCGITVYRVNILKSINEGPFQMGTFWDTLAEGNEGALHLDPKRARVYSDLSPEDKERFITAVKLNRGLMDSNYDQLYAYLKQHEAHSNENKMMLDRFTQHIVDPLALMSNVSHQQYYSQSSTTLPSTYGHQNRGQGNNARGTGTAGYGGAQNRVGNANPGQARQIKCYNYNGIGHIARNNTQPKRPQNSEYFKYKMLLMQVQENRVALDEEQLLFIAGGHDNVVDEDMDGQ